MKRSIIRTCILALALGLTSLAATAEDPPAWELSLRVQLLAEQQCNLNYLTNVKVQQLGSIQSIEARAHCMNGQAFDVRSLKGQDRFDIKECGVSVC
jgi:hypothetical protein